MSLKLFLNINLIQTDKKTCITNAVGNEKSKKIIMEVINVTMYNSPIKSLFKGTPRFLTIIPKRK